LFYLRVYPTLPVKDLVGQCQLQALPNILPSLLPLFRAPQFPITPDNGFIPSVLVLFFVAARQNTRQIHRPQQCEVDEQKLTKATLGPTMLKQKVVKAITTMLSNSINRNESFDSRRKQQTMSLGKLKSNREKIRTANILGTKRETPVKCLKGIMACSSKQVTQLTTQVKCLYINAHSTSSKQELKATVHLESYDLITITEIRWEGSHDCSAAVDD